MNQGDTHTERKLLAQVAQGNQQAFRELFLTYQPQLYTAAFKVLDNAELAEDVCQDTFLLVWLKRETLTSIDHFANWLFIVARNKMYDAVKKAAKQKTERLDFLHIATAATDTDQHHALQAKQLQQLFHQAVTQLPERQQQAYRLMKQEGLSREEAAKRMNVSAETVKSHLENATRNIRAYCLSRVDPGTVFVLFLLFR